MVTRLEFPRFDYDDWRREKGNRGGVQSLNFFGMFPTERENPVKRVVIYASVLKTGSI
jgi:hypothetical protein